MARCRPMPTPKIVSTRWKHLATTSDVEADGTLHSSIHIMETESGEDFVVTLSGRGAADGAYWIGALKAAVAVWQQATGQPLSESTSIVPPNTSH